MPQLWYDLKAHHNGDTNHIAKDTIIGTVPPIRPVRVLKTKQRKRFTKSMAKPCFLRSDQ